MTLKAVKDYIFVAMNELRENNPVKAYLTLDAALKIIKEEDGDEE